MHYHNDNPLTSCLLEAIFTNDLPAIDNLLSKHPELLAVYSFDSTKISPLMQAVNLALRANNLDIFKCMLLHGAALPYYNANLIEDLLSSKTFISDDFFKLIINELFQYLSCPDERQSFLQNVFISLIRYGNYPRCMPQINFLFELGLETDFRYFSLPADTLEQDKKLALLHFKLILEDIYINLNLEQCDKHGQNIINLIKHILPNYEEQLTSLFNIDNLFTYLATPDLIPSDFVLQKFIHFTNDLEQLEQTANRRYLFKPTLYFQSWAAIHNTFKRANLNTHAKLILENVLKSNVFDKAKFAIEVFANQKINEKFHDVIDLIVESINHEQPIEGYEALKRSPELALKFLEVLMFYNLYSDNHPLVKTLHTLSITEKLPAIRTLLEPTINSSSNQPELIAHVFKARQKLAQQIILEFTETDKYQLINGTDDPNSSFGYLRKTSAERITTIDRYYHITWLIPVFNQIAIDNLIANIDLDEVTNNEEFKENFLAIYFIAAYQLERYGICTNIISKLKMHANTSSIIVFCSFLIKAAIQNGPLWLLNGKDAIFLMNIKNFIINTQQVEYEYSDLHTWNKLNYLKLARHSVEYIIQYIQALLERPMEHSHFAHPKNQIEIIKNASFKAMLMLKDFDNVTYQACLIKISQMLTVVLKRIYSKVTNDNSTNLDKLTSYFAFMQELDYLCSIDLKIMLAIFKTNDQTLTSIAIKYLRNINFKIIHEIYADLDKINDLDDKKLCLSQALAFTFFLPENLVDNKLIFLRMCLTIQVFKNGHDKEPQNIESLKRIQKSQCFVPYFNALLLSTSNAHIPQKTKQKMQTPKV